MRSGGRFGSSKGCVPSKHLKAAGDGTGLPSSKGELWSGLGMTAVEGNRREEKIVPGEWESKRAGTG